MTQSTNSYEFWMYGTERDTLPSQEKPMVTYQVLVGNLGWVTNPTPNKEEALVDYTDYITISKHSPSHRGYQKQVSLWASDESDPIEMYEPPEVEEEETDEPV